MRQILVVLAPLLALLFTNATNPTSAETQKLIKNITQTIKKKSIVADRIDWATLSKDIKSIDYTGNHHTDKEKVYALFTKYLHQAGDNHSLFLSATASSRIRASQHENAYATSRYLGGHTAYLKIPACMTFDHQKDLTFTDTIISQIKALDQHEIDKWIIDVRDNNGGNVWPMLSGLTPIIGDGLINYSIGRGTEKANFIKQGFITNSKTSTLKYNTKRQFKKLAILINQRTASSGEMLALSLAGFDNTKSFGHKTRGFTTVNTTFPLRDGTLLFLATGFMADKNKKTYRDGITPDIILKNDLTDEAIITKVTKWLNE